MSAVLDGIQCHNSKIKFQCVAEIFQGDKTLKSYSRRAVSMARPTNPKRYGPNRIFPSSKCRLGIQLDVNKHSAEEFQRIILFFFMFFVVVI